MKQEKKGSPKRRSISLRLPVEEIERLDAEAEALGVTRNEVISSSVLGRRLPPPLPIEAEILHEACERFRREQCRQGEIQETLKEVGLRFAGYGGKCEDAELVERAIALSMEAEDGLLGLEELLSGMLAQSRGACLTEPPR